MGDQGTFYSQEVLAEGALVGVGAAIGAAHGVVVAGTDDAHGFSSCHVGGAVGLGKGTRHVSKQTEGCPCPNPGFAALGGYCEESLWLLRGERKFISSVLQQNESTSLLLRLKVILARIMGKNDHSLGNQGREDIRQIFNSHIDFLPALCAVLTRILHY